MTDFVEDESLKEQNFYSSNSSSLSHIYLVMLQGESLEEKRVKTREEKGRK